MSSIKITLEFDDVESAIFALENFKASKDAIIDKRRMERNLAICNLLSQGPKTQRQIYAGLRGKHGEMTLRLSLKDLVKAGEISMHEETGLYSLPKS